MHISTGHLAEQDRGSVTDSRRPDRPLACELTTISMTDVQQQFS